jgi:hypothetical protein
LAPAAALFVALQQQFREKMHAALWIIFLPGRKLGLF